MYVNDEQITKKGHGENHVIKNVYLFLHGYQFILKIHQTFFKRIVSVTQIWYYFINSVLCLKIYQSLSSIFTDNKKKYHIFCYSLWPCLLLYLRYPLIFFGPFSLFSTCAIWPLFLFEHKNAKRMNLVYRWTVNVNRRILSFKFSTRKIRLCDFW